MAEALQIRRPDDSGEDRFARLRREEGREQIAFGALLLAIGAVITVLTYSFASTGGAGIYVVAYGPIVVGVIRIAQGLSKRFG